MLSIRLKRGIEWNERQFGRRLSHDDLARMTGLSRATIDSIASRADYNPTLKTVELLCDALRCTPTELLEYTPHSPKD